MPVMVNGAPELFAAHALSPTSRVPNQQLVAIADPGGAVGASLEKLVSYPTAIVDDMVPQSRFLIGRVGPDSVTLGSEP